jgi:hypothetical protein
METYSFDPPERSMSTGSLTSLFYVAAAESFGSSCTVLNRGVAVTKADSKALDLQSFILEAIDTSVKGVQKTVTDDGVRTKIESAMSAAHAGTEFAFLEVMNESFAIPKVEVRCSTIPPTCTGQSYRKTVSNYRSHLLTLRRTGLYANRIASLATTGKPSSRNAVAKKIKQLHRAALRATTRLPRQSVECPSG